MAVDDGCMRIPTSCEDSCRLDGEVSIVDYAAVLPCCVSDLVMSVFHVNSSELTVGVVDATVGCVLLIVSGAVVADLCMSAPWSECLVLSFKSSISLTVPAADAEVVVCYGVCYI